MQDSLSEIRLWHAILSEKICFPDSDFQENSTEDWILLMKKLDRESAITSADAQMNETENPSPAWLGAEETEDLKTRITGWRRDLHQIPETALHTPQTAAYCRKALEDKGFTMIDLHENDPESDSFAAFLDLGKDTSIAFRTDMDALPVHEKTGLPFASRNEGCMHACGHDGHMSLLLGFAHAIDADHRKNALDSNILLIFQAGEETPGGANRITRTGLFEKLHVSQVFGTHLWPMIDKGVIATRPLELMAMASELTITVHGKSAHAARYKEGIDAMEIGAGLLLDLYALEQTLDEKEYRLLRFGKMTAGTAMNAVAAECVLEGTLRSFLDPVTVYLKEGIARIVQSWQEKTGCTIDVDYAPGYPAVLNDPALCEALFAAHPEVVRLENPEMIAEDFSEYQKKAPGIFFFLGTGTGIPLHADRFDFDESIALEMIRLYLSLALEPLPLKTADHPACPA